MTSSKPTTTTQYDSPASRLDALLAHWQRLTPSSPDAQFQAFASFFAADCTAWLLSMREVASPSVGRAGVVQGIRDAVATAQVKDRRVVSLATSTTTTSTTSTTSTSTTSTKNASTKVVFCETANTIVVHGHVVENFPETVVARFNNDNDDEDEEEGGQLIVDLKVYSCRSPVVEIVQAVTGAGPYRPELVPGLSGARDKGKGKDELEGGRAAVRGEEEAAVVVAAADASCCSTSG
ncbi:hypothetical protein F4778DRAFT_315030 [Xylariomycetidae sp. FL2044]|nr:hypothetical protein F4778DRAFT_315030 [Xylariomycetidae sp. FL2044]